MHRRATTVLLGERDQVPSTSGRMRNQKVDKISDFRYLLLNGRSEELVLTLS